MSATPVKPTDTPSTDSVDWSSIQARVRKHIVWKEGRFLLPACIGLLTLVLLGMIASGLSPLSSLTANASIFISLAIGGATMAALVCGSVAFSLERENQTDKFLARLPLSGTKLTRVKIATATIYFLCSYVIALLMAVGLFALFFAGQNLLNQVSSRAVLGSTTVVAFLMPGVCFLWSMMFSRYLQSTLSTVLLAAFCVLLTPSLLFGSTAAIGYLLGLPDWLETWLLSALFLIQVSLLAYAIGRQPSSWLRPSSVTAPMASAGTMDTPVHWNKVKTSYVTSTKALLWQTFRLRWLGSLIALLVCSLYLLVMLSAVTILVLGGYEQGSVTIESTNDIFAALLAGATGLFLFSKDQAGSSFRFFQQRADYPRRIWFARIIQLIAIGLVVVLVISVVNRALYSMLVAFSQSYEIDKRFGLSAINYQSNIFSLYFHRTMEPTNWPYFLWLTLRSATMFFVVAAVGQLVSIFCRHGILNALLGIVFCTMAAFWVRCVNWYQVPVWSLAWPIGIAALALSWAYAPSWIRGTRQFRWSVASTLVMVGVSGACIFGMRQDRLNDYPIQPILADLDELYENPEKLKSNGDPRFKVAREIDAAISKINLAWSNIIDQGKGSKEIPKQPRKFTAAELQLVQDERDAFEKIEKLVQDSDARYYFYQSPDAAKKIGIRKYGTIEDCLALNQAAARESGDSERVQAALFAELAYVICNRHFEYPKQLADLLDWVDTDVQTSEQILPLIDQVESIIQSDLSPNNLAWLETTYFFVRENLEDYENDGLDLRADLPWEYERTKRQQQYELLKTWNQKRQFLLKHFGSRKVIPKLANEMPMNLQPTKAPMRDNLDFRYSENSAEEYSTLEWLRYAQVRLALAAWRCDNQGYPKKLEELRGDYLAPASPANTLGTGNLEPALSGSYLRTKYSYHPDGLNLPVVLSSSDLFSQYAGSRADQVDAVIPADTPFLLPWTALPTEQRYFQIKIPSEQDESNFSLTDPALGYSMGQPSTAAYNWGSRNRYPKLYLLGPKKSAARDSDE